MMLELFPVRIQMAVQEVPLIISVWTWRLTWRPDALIREVLCDVKSVL